MLRSVVGWALALVLLLGVGWRERVSARREFEMKKREIAGEIAKSEREARELGVQLESESARRSKAQEERWLKPALEVEHAWRTRVDQLRAQSTAMRAPKPAAEDELKQALAALECAEAGYRFALPPPCEKDCGKSQ